MGGLFAAMGLVFLAELGDKTQLVAMSFGARYRLTPVLVGVALAYMTTNLVSVVVGGLLGATLPTRAIGIAGGALFLLFAWLTWRDRPDPDPDEPAEVAPSPTPTRHVVMSVASTMFLAELGDKTMLATATLAAQGNPIAVWIGATVGIILAGALGAVVGRVLGDRMPERAIRIGSSLLFAVFGVILIVTSL